MLDARAVLGLAQEALHGDRVLRQARTQDLHRGRGRAPGARRDRRWRCRPRRCTRRGGSRPPCVPPCCRRSWIRQASYPQQPASRSRPASTCLTPLVRRPLTFRRPARPRMWQLHPGVCMRRLVISVVRGCGRPRLRQLEPRRQRGDEPTACRAAHPRSSTAPSSTRSSAGWPPASRCRSSAPWRSPPGPADSVIGVLGPLAREPRARLPARGQRLRRALPGEPLVQARGRAARWTWPARRSSGCPPSRRRSGATRAFCSSRSSGCCRAPTTSASRCATSARPPRAAPRATSRRRRSAPAPRQRADPGVPGDGAGKPGRSAATWCSTRAARSATAATRCWRTSRATASPSPTTVPVQGAWTSSST